MPRTTPEARRMTDSIGPKERGDYTFLKYRPMIRAFKKNPRWTTADELASGLFPDPDKRAEFLAYLVLFIEYVWPYERLKALENGEVE